MFSELERRTAIIVALRCGRAPKEIIDFFKCPQSYCLQHCQVLQGVGGHRGRIPNTGKKDSRPIPSQEEERRLH
ncbi:Hypothetical protein FKW44_007193 [Caligus rogercresseyi]|uniref:Uncharacterized protein n=1 Tax=Caligus rogercresseyi TaxID=217165 RepID=A0A7T8QTE6_CALRO|nr:Hypothetical protein FKW44_007188 [Caligus rogercresseyi]QQP54378.1 Hypothetical protein FKW44_007193 [Caligus rogercresseyi]